MLVTTTPQLENIRIIEYKGVVTGETVVGINFVKDLFAGIRDIFGGRTRSYENEISKARTHAIDEMVRKAQEWGCNAVVGIDLDYESVGKKGSMIMVSASGTAVIAQSNVQPDHPVQQMTA